ncbi:acyltransferase [Leifsonia sp. fls2-241-R2A-40a]|uniref:acyltransferase family protein n=1 Tax=Leifsonia sp. fls2-241-R2A-40a TaxID=3040290 RepID=UPI00255112DD|nr:acyltransferase [Leifsonia sp. fls2-241-R2A-40a]
MSNPQSTRYASLDGLRGVASLVVLGYHALLVVPAISALYIDKVDPSAFSPEWWLFKTPFRLLFAGHEAVLVFFVLSGFVLTLPFLSRPPTRRSTLAYYGRRIVRLYVPVWASLVLALALALAVPRNPAMGGWMGTHHAPTVSSTWHDPVLLFGTSNLNSPLWSLTWEVWFSLLMPVMFLLIRFTRAARWWWAAIPLLMLVSAAARFDVIRRALPDAGLTADLLQYLPVFGIGMLLAVNRNRLAAAAGRIRTWWPIVAGALLLTISPTLIAPNGYGVGQAFAYLLSLTGVAGIVVLAFASPVRRPLEARPVQWAGTRSFSIYLVHEPILVATALLVGANGWWWLLTAAAVIPIILLTAEVFHRFVERPSITLSRAVGRAIEGRRATAPVPAAVQNGGSVSAGP